MEKQLSIKKALTYKKVSFFTKGDIS